MKIACVLGPKFEDSEFKDPYDAFRNAGNEITIVGLEAGKERTVFLVEGEAVNAPRRGRPSSVVHKFDLSKRKAEKLLDGVSRFHIRERTLDRPLVLGHHAEEQP